MSHPNDPCPCREPAEHTIKGIPLKGACGLHSTPHHVCGRADWRPVILLESKPAPEWSAVRALQEERRGWLIRSWSLWQRR